MISAQRSRQNKKQEHSQYQSEIVHFKQQFGVITEVLNTVLKGACREKIISSLLAKMPDTTAFEELPEFHVSSSAPLGGQKLGEDQRLNRQSSRGAPEKRRAKDRANQLVNILNSFAGID